MRAHVLDLNNIIVNTIVVHDLNFMPNLIDASLGGQIGDIYDEEAGTFTKSPERIAYEAELIQREADRIQKFTDIQANLPSWAEVTTAIDNINNMAQAKAYLLKLSRVVYWLAKDTSE